MAFGGKPKLPAPAPMQEIAPAPVATATATNITDEVKRKKKARNNLFYLRTQSEAGLGKAGLG
jgi:hypothetical protein